MVSFVLVSIFLASARYSSACFAVGIVLDDRHAADFGPLHHVVAGDEVDHLGAERGGQRLDQVGLTGGVARVADQAAEADAARVGVLDDPLGDVVGGVHRHHLAGDDDVDLLGLLLADRHREAAADDVAQDVIEDEVQVLVVGAFFLEEVDRRDHAAAGAADARFRAAGLDALDPAVALLHDHLELEVLDPARFGGQGHDRVLGLLVKDQPGRVGLRIAADDQDVLPLFSQRATRF